ncbi:MAG TPA: SPOR domain-containing protein [Pseudolabrys sp.]|nr:SPOR domain-containing protein [Pseudolabrys sp.]
MAREMPPERAELPDNLRLGRNMQSPWRLGAWGAAAALSLAVAVLVAQSEPGKERLRHAFAATAAPVKAGAGGQASVRTETESRITPALGETQRIAEKVDALSSDRDRLAQRVTTLELQLQKVTSSIEHRSAPMAVASPKQEPVPSLADPIASIAPSDAPVRPPPETRTAPAPQHAVDAQKPIGVVSATPISIAPAVTPPPVAAAPKSASKRTETEGHHEAEIKLPTLVRLPPRRAPMHRAASRASFGVDLGSAVSVDEVKAQWAAIKANFGPILTGLDSVPTHDSRPGQDPYRLVVGPLPNIEAAHRLCAQFAIGQVACRPVELESQTLVQR